MKKQKRKPAHTQSPQAAKYLQALELTQLINHAGKEEFAQMLENVFELAFCHTPAELFNQQMQWDLYLFNEVVRTVRKWN